MSPVPSTPVAVESPEERQLKLRIAELKAQGELAERKAKELVQSADEVVLRKQLFEQKIVNLERTLGLLIEKSEIVQTTVQRFMHGAIEMIRGCEKSLREAEKIFDQREKEVNILEEKIGVRIQEFSVLEEKYQIWERDLKLYTERLQEKYTQKGMGTLHF